MATPTITPRRGSAERLSRMIQIPTVSAEIDDRGAEPFEAFVTLLEELYPLVHTHLERERITDFGLLFRWRGSSDRPPLVLMAHYDVVPVDETDDWTHPPFEGRIEDGWVYGRGTLDDKGPLLVVLEAVENLLSAGWAPPRDVYLSFGGNEETFGAAAEQIAATFRSRGITPWLVLDEGGAVVDAPLPIVRGRAAMIGVGEKGILTVRLTARGEGGHASAPPTTTAVRRIARAVERLDPDTFRVRPPRALGAMLAGFAPQTPQPMRSLLRVLAALPPVTGRVFAKLGGEAAAMVRTTVAATMQSGGTAANVLPSQATATLNLRIALGETTATTLARIRRRVSDPLVHVEALESSDPSPESPVDDPRFDLLRSAVGVSHPAATAVPYVMMAATDSRHFHRFTEAVYRFAPLTMSNEQRAAIHGVDERVEVAELLRGEEFHRALLTALR